MAKTALYMRNYRAQKKAQQAVINATVIQPPTPAPQPAPPAPQDDDDEDVLDTQPDVADNDTEDEEDYSRTSVVDWARNNNDAQKAQLITAAINQDVPDFLSDNPMQALMYNNELGTTPQIVDDATFDAMKGEAIYRQVAAVYDRSTGLTIKSSQIANQVMNGDDTMYSDSGGSAYGKAVYFGNDYNEIINYYGTSRVNGRQDSTAFRAKIVAGAKGISNNTLSSNYRTELYSGSALGKALQQVARHDHSSALSMYAVAKGYQYSYDRSSGYYMIYDRGCLAIAQTTKHNASSNRQNTW